MKKIKAILLIISVTFISCVDKTIAPDLLDDEASLIVWDNISGKIAYKKNNLLYLADKKSKTVKNLGTCNLFNLKWNKSRNEITGVLSNNGEYSLEAYDLNGNHYELDEPSSFNSWSYDWLPDGRLVHKTILDYVYIENSKLIDHKFNGFYIACSPDGKKIAVSESTNSISTLIEIDIATGDISIIESGRNYGDKVYSPDNKKLLFVKSTYNWFGDIIYDLCITPNISLGRAGQNPDWSPDGQRVICTYTNNYLEKTTIYVMNINGNDYESVIPDGFNPLWIEQ